MVVVVLFFGRPCHRSRRKRPPGWGCRSERAPGASGRLAPQPRAALRRPRRYRLERRGERQAPDQFGHPLDKPLVGFLINEDRPLEDRAPIHSSDLGLQAVDDIVQCA